MSSFFPFRECLWGALFLTAALPTKMWGGNTAWLSGNGVDAGFCPYDAPCSTFYYASGVVYNANSSHGEIFILNPGVYTSLFSPMNWGKSQTWDGGEGNLATLVNSNILIGTGTDGGGSPFSINNVIILRNLTLIGEGFSGPAIQIGSDFNGATLIIENCKIYGYAPSDGVGVIDYSGGGDLIIKNTIIESNTGDAIKINSVGNVSLSSLAIKNNIGNALNASGGPIVDINDSVLTQNSGTAILSQGTNTTINCINNVLTSNGTAIGVASSGLVRISNNDIYNHNTFINYLDETGSVNTANNNRAGSNGSFPNLPNGSILIQ